MIGCLMKMSIQRVVRQKREDLKMWSFCWQ